MSDATLWINDADSTATIVGTNVSYTMPLWVFDVIRDVIMVEAEKKVEVTHRDFDIQQELLDRYKADNAKLRERCADLYAEMITYSKAPNYNASVWAPKLREVGVEVDG